MTLCYFHLTAMKSIGFATKLQSIGSGGQKLPYIGKFSRNFFCCFHSLANKLKLLATLKFVEILCTLFGFYARVCDALALSAVVATNGF